MQTAVTPQSPRVFPSSFTLSGCSGFKPRVHPCWFHLGDSEPTSLCTHETHRQADCYDPEKAMCEKRGKPSSSWTGHTWESVQQASLSSYRSDHIWLFKISTGQGFGNVVLETFDLDMSILVAGNSSFGFSILRFSLPGSPSEILVLCSTIKISFDKPNY
jgi:hypothetical protein